MKRNNLLKITISLAIVSLLTIFAVTFNASAGVFAADGEWTTNDLRTELYHDGTTYYSHEVPSYYRVTMWNTDVLQVGTYMKQEVVTYAQDKSILFTYSGIYADYYVTDEKFEDLKNYFNGSEGLYFLSTKYYDVGAAFDKADGIIANYSSAQKTAIDVTTLSRASIYNKLIFTDKTKTFLTTVGEFYYTKGKLYYVHFAELPNNAFDADGNLSYRSGEVPMYELNESEIAAHDEAYGNFDNFHTYKYSDNGGYDDGRGIELTPRVVWSFILGITLPLMIFVWSLVLLIRKRRATCNRLILPVITSAVWLIAGVIVFVLLI